MRIGAAGRCSETCFLNWFYSPRAVGTTLSEVRALYRVPSSYVIRSLLYIAAHRLLDILLRHS